ncbi:MarR family winged helix-turn-helix transcriptional regulator [Demequina sp. NBRC 110054]|uniref:MarR family winged helix-turn-helix transcriptional regulator n=1 Tax=Demequina sp. NBRC 110054 TaxID=1570343 RepID=UPI000A0001A3|nr:MarR family winged helix-turn-helix transcriptional regulator [Demequina sp. NBRC 110054]
MTETEATAKSGRTAVQADLADLAAAVLVLARRLHAAEQRAEGLVPLGGVEVLVMQHVDRHPGVSPSALAVAIGLKPSNASAAIRALEEKGLVERRKAEDDARCVELWATARAAENLASLRAHWRDLLAPHVDDLDSAASAAEFLERIDEALTGPPS